MSYANGSRCAGGKEVAGTGLSVHICVVFDYMESSPMKNRHFHMAIMLRQNRLYNKTLGHLIHFFKIARD